jgi:hypothetical protein
MRFNPVGEGKRSITLRSCDRRVAHNQGRPWRRDLLSFLANKMDEIWLLVENVPIVQGSQRKLPVSSRGPRR